jgi:hypothetical protein
MYLALVLFVAVAIYFTVSRFRRSESTTLGVGSTITFELSRVLEPHLGANLTADALSQLEKEVENELDISLALRGLSRGPWRIVLHQDPIMGPECFLFDGTREVSLHEFELGIVEDRIELPLA